MAPFLTTELQDWGGLQAMGGMAGPPQGQGTGPETRWVSGAGLSPAQHREEGEPDEPRDADGIAFSVLLGVGEKQAGKQRRAEAADCGC